jgi:precorrin-3B C17-methyltransferase
MQERQRHGGGSPGYLAAVSLGPGFPDYLIPQARAALEEAQVVVGYQTYIALVQPLLSHQEVVATGMKDEVKRCRLAIDRALAGQRVALVSSGDAGIYGMAGLVLEMCAARGLKVGPPQGDRTVDFYLEVIPGVPALAAAAALLGAPLMHDFAAISLSDLLTPWEIIERRLQAAARADLVIVLYNPKSKKRHWQLGAVRDLMLSLRDPQTPVGIVSRAMREGQQTTLTTLEAMLAHPVDMQTVIIVGNSQTYTYGPYMITPRGYQAKYRLDDPPAAPGGLTDKKSRL